MNRRSISKNGTHLQIANQRTLKVLHSATIYALAVIAAFSLWNPAAAQSADVRPSHNSAVTLSASSDSDGDRVVDAQDMCPGTAEGWSVKHNGCPLYARTSMAGAIAASGSEPTKLALNADILFATASASISPQGESILTRFASELKAAPPPPAYRRELHLTGYADLTGQWSSNLALSQRRADAVRLHLMGQGVPAESMKATGRGAADPVVQCPNKSTQAERVACLAPNRRVEVEIRQLPLKP